MLSCINSCLRVIQMYCSSSIINFSNSSLLQQEHLKYIKYKMIYKSLATTVAILSVTSTNGFFIQPPRAVTTATRLDMAAGLVVPINERTKALNKVKDLYGGRLDLGSMSDETEVMVTYD